MDEITQISGWWIGLTTAITALVTLVLTKGTDSILKLWKARTDAQQATDHQALAGYEALISEQNKRITTLEGQLKEVQNEHLECVKLQERLKGANEKFSSELQVLREEVNALRKWRHDLADAEHTALLKKDAEKLPTP